jgi:hypothetical protein
MTIDAIPYGFPQLNSLQKGTYLPGRGLKGELSIAISIISLFSEQ